MKEMSAFIDDGFTEAGYICAVPGLRPACRFEYRPCISEERAAFSQKTKGLEGNEIESRSVLFLLERLVSWDQKGPDGVVRPITEANIRRLRPSTASRMFGIVIGTEASDADPEASFQATTQAAADKVEAREQGKPFRASA